MVHYRRDRTSGATYFFTVALADRPSRLLLERIDWLRESWAQVARECFFRTEAAVILPDHLHTIWRMPEEDSDYGRRWQRIKGGFTRQWHKAFHSPTTSSPWQARFWEHRIRDEADLAAHVAYVHFNPVKHGYAIRAGDWPHSSIHRWVRDGRLPRSWLNVTAANGSELRGVAGRE